MSDMDMPKTEMPSIPATETGEALAKEALEGVKTLKLQDDKYATLTAELANEEQKKLRAVKDIAIAEEGLASAVSGPIQDSLKGQLVDAQRRAKVADDQTARIQKDIEAHNA